MSKLTWAMALAGFVLTVEVANAQTILTTPAEVQATVTANEAALDRQLAHGAIEIRGIAKRILRSETGYTLQFLPDNDTDNFVRVEINCEFLPTERDALGALRMPALLAVRGNVKASGWTPRYDNHKYYTLVVKDCSFAVINPPVLAPPVAR